MTLPPVESATLVPPQPWRQALWGETREPYFGDLQRFVAAERGAGLVYPAPDRVFAALALTPPAEVKVVLLGQDPYHGPGQAHGLSFSVPAGTPPPPSLRNIFLELNDDLGHPAPAHGCLEAWASRGVLLLNTVLTVRGGTAGSHAGPGWERFTDRMIEGLNEGSASLVFLLWGRPARAKASLIDTSRHTILESSHPSPLSAYRGFLGSRPFSRTNAALRENGRGEIDWRL